MHSETAMHSSDFSLFYHTAVERKTPDRGILRKKGRDGSHGKAFQYRRHRRIFSSARWSVRQTVLLFTPCSRAIWLMFSCRK